MRFGITSLRTALALMLCSAVGVGTALAQESNKSIPWSASTFSLTAVDEDVGRLLRRVVQADGKRLIIKPGVKGTATVQFQNVPLAAAFNQLVQENELEFSYNPANKTVTVFSKVAAAIGREMREFISPQVTSFGKIKMALQAHRLGAAGITFDEDSRTISVFGSQDRVGEIRSLVERLDNSEMAKRQRANDQAAKNSALVLQRQQANKAKEQARVVAAQAEFERRMVERVLDFKVKVIRLRFASVSSTEKKFQDKTFSVPGIEETLQKILGIPVRANTGPTNQSPSRRLLGQAGVILPAAGAGSRPGQASSGPVTTAAAEARFDSALRPMISVDPRTNSVIVRGTQQAINEVEKIIKELDKPLRMIEIEVVIVKADSTVTEELGLTYRARGFSQTTSKTTSQGIDTGSTSSQVSETSDVVDALSLLPSAGTGRVVSTLLLKSTEALFQTQLAAFAQNNRAQIISAPRVVTLDNVTARVTRATNLFFETTASGDSGTTLTEVETGLELSILPSIIPSDVAGEQNLVRLELSARNSSPTAAATGGSVDVASSEVQTQVLIPDGGTFVMAGLFDDTRAEDERGIPFLKDIPFLGAFFRTNTSSDTLTETIFFITPRIVDERRLTRDIAARVGTREYMKRQRNLLSNVSRQSESSKNRFFPNVLNRLEEDE